MVENGPKTLFMKSFLFWQRGKHEYAINVSVADDYEWFAITYAARTKSGAFRKFAKNFKKDLVKEFGDFDRITGVVKWEQ